ncbi:MAG: agmatinase family protein [Bacteroidia bacterium]|nr:agmatinase family protein [Bacteroidia bacterium]MCZ2249418.1 agmatinase family protein [Bacteroidia bacterium]
MSKQEKIKNFNPNNPASSNSNIFGLPFNKEEASIILLPLPWEVTVSYNSGTANAPNLIFDASHQVDLFDPYIKDAWKIGIYMDEINNNWKKKSDELRNKAVQIISFIINDELEKVEEKAGKLYHEINEGGRQFNQEVKEYVADIINQGKIIGGVGGDHSTPLGIIQAVADKYESFGILHLDAHSDLRDAFEGFEYSHASIMYNALKIPQVSKLVQVGIRDYCEEEYQVIINSNNRVKTFFDRDIKQAQYQGKHYHSLVEEIISELPQKIYLSFDADALDPKLCPHTGTPVAGGFETDQVLYLLEKIVESGKQIVAFDLNETGNNEWDANVSSRLLYRVCNLVARSNNLI